MRIIVYPHDLGIGGSQLNAIQLALAARRQGHEVAVYGQRGPLADDVEAAGVQFVQSPDVHIRPTPAVAAHLARFVRAWRADIVHGYEWPPSLEALLACRMAGQGRAVATVLSMDVAPFIPRYMPLAVGTAQMRKAQHRAGWAQVDLLEPPVDVGANAPGAVLVEGFRREHGIHHHAFTVSIVSRLARELKLEGIIGAMEAVSALHREGPAQLVVCGGGPAQAEVFSRADQINQKAGTNVIVCTGELREPRPAYAVADVGIGMGSSALRSMAFGIPLVVQGERGFWTTLTPSTAPTFLWQGWYGVGNGVEDSAGRLAVCLRALRDDPTLRQRLGSFARDLAMERFSVDVVAERQMAFYERALASSRRPRRAVESIRSASAWAAYTLRRYLQSRGGTAPADDFNSRPLAAQSVGAGPSPTRKAN